MRLRVLAFASASDALGAAESALEVAPRSSVADFKSELLSRFPAIAPLLPRLAIAVDGAIVSDSHLLAEGAEVALLPPVSGG